MQMRSKVMVGGLIVVVAAFGAYLVRHGSKPPAQGDIVSNTTAVDVPAFLRDVIATRALAIESPATLAAQLDAMPGGVFDRVTAHDAYRQTLWSQFFKGSMTKLGRTSSVQPLAVYYNPVIDIAVVKGCRANGSAASVHCDALCAIPGETLNGEQPQAAAPAWLAAADPLSELTTIASARMQAFEKTHPAQSSDTTQWDKQYCGERLQAAAELRLAEASSALAALDPAALRKAIALYVAAALKPTGKSTELATYDAVLPLIMNADQFSLTGAVAIGDQGWIVFLTPKKTGWRQAALVLQRDTKGQIRIRGVRLLSISTLQS